METIRLARLDDASQIAHVHVDCWRSTYKDIIPAEYLASLDYDEREQIWKRALSRENHAIFVAENAEGSVIGFCTGGPERDNNPLYRGELYAIYILPAYQGKKLGLHLVQVLVQRLLNDGFTTMLVWVLADNPACQFYKALGGQFVRAKNEDFHGVTLQEHAYGWDETRLLSLLR